MIATITFIDRNKAKESEKGELIFRFFGFRCYVILIVYCYYILLDIGHQAGVSNKSQLIFAVYSPAYWFAGAFR